MKTALSKKILTKYLSSPPYLALSVTGAWGAGKTYFVRELLEDNNKNFIFVSMAGCVSFADFEHKLTQQIFESWAKNKPDELKFIAVKTIKDLRKSWQQLTSKITQGKLFGTSSGSSELMNYTGQILRTRLIDELDVIIMDDIERCQITKPQEVVACINLVVENYKKRTIVICNQEELPEELREFPKISEKAIGKEIRFKSDLLPAISYFCSEENLDHPSESLVTNLYAKLKERDYFDKEGTNLRIIRRCIHDVNELFDHKFLKGSEWDDYSTDITIALYELTSFANKKALTLSKLGQVLMFDYFKCSEQEKKDLSTLNREVHKVIGNGVERAVTKAIGNFYLHGCNEMFCELILKYRAETENSNVWYPVWSVHDIASEEDLSQKIEYGRNMIAQGDVFDLGTVVHFYSSWAELEKSDDAKVNEIVTEFSDIVSTMSLESSDTLRSNRGSIRDAYAGCVFSKTDDEKSGFYKLIDALEKPLKKIDLIAIEDLKKNILTDDVFSPDLPVFQPHNNLINSINKMHPSISVKLLNFSDEENKIFIDLVSNSSIQVIRRFNKTLEKLLENYVFILSDKNTNSTVIKKSSEELKNNLTNLNDRVRTVIESLPNLPLARLKATHLGFTLEHIKNWDSTLKIDT